MGRLMAANLAKRLRVQSLRPQRQGQLPVGARGGATAPTCSSPWCRTATMCAKPCWTRCPACKRGAVVIDMSSSDPAGTLALGKVLKANRIAHGRCAGVGRALQGEGRHARHHGRRRAAGCRTRCVPGPANDGQPRSSTAGSSAPATPSRRSTTISAPPARWRGSRRC